MTPYNKRLLDWAVKSGIAQNTTYEKQYMKFIEELGEFCSAVNKGNDHEAKKELIDVWVTINMCNLQDAKSMMDYLDGSDVDSVGILVEGLLCEWDSVVMVEIYFSSLINKIFTDMAEFEEYLDKTLTKLEFRLKGGKVVNGIFIKEEDL